MAPEAPAPPAYVHPDYARLSPAELLVESQRKGVMGRKRSLTDVRRIVEQVGPIVAEAVRRPEVTAALRELAGDERALAAARAELQRLQEADLLLESGGDPNAVSSAGAVGVAQWLAETGRRAGLHVDPEEYRRIVTRARAVRASIAELRRHPPEWRRPMQAGGPARSRDEWIAARTAELRALERRRLAADERYDPHKAIVAQTRYLVRLWRQFGSLDWALQAYHGGVRGAQRTIALFTGTDRPATIPSFAEVYFGISPRRRTQAFSYVYGRADDHRYYWWRVLAAAQAIQLYRDDPARFRAEWEALAPGFPLDRAWYPEALREPFADVAALRAAHRRGILLAIPDAPRRYGFAPRAVAPLDPDNERWYRGVRPEALGMMHTLAALYQAEGGRAPLRVTGAAATVAYARQEAATRGEAEAEGQGSPAEASGTAEEAPPPPLTLHAAGLCVDVARPAASWDRKVLEYALSYLGDRMRIAWLRDFSADAYHLCPNPAFAAEHRASLSGAPASGAGR
ncbi:MAG: lytic transglycosylase domain-containing protein [Armatimonadetes bacterium]|nr:lytic transglycosylase domain-containing protein [Armatimonadota bacterium]